MKKVAVGIFLCFLLFHLSCASYAQEEKINFYDIFDYHKSIMFVFDIQTGQIVYANQAASDFYGYSVAQLKNMRFQQISNLSDREISQYANEAAKANQFIITHRLADGSVRTVSINSYPYESDGKTYLFSIFNDISDQKQLLNSNRILYNSFILMLSSLAVILFFIILLLYKKNKEIINHNELHETFINADRSLIYLKDNELRYIFVNRAFEQFYQLSGETVIGKDDYAITGADFAYLRRKTDLAVLENNTLLLDEIRWNGRIYKTTKFPVKLKNGQSGVGAYIRDITREYHDRRKTELSNLRNRILVDILNRDYQTEQEQMQYVLCKCMELIQSSKGFLLLSEQKFRGV